MYVLIIAKDWQLEISRIFKFAMISRLLLAFTIIELFCPSEAAHCCWLFMMRIPLGRRGIRTMGSADHRPTTDHDAITPN
jgi:hypothetical protein